MKRIALVAALAALAATVATAAPADPVAGLWQTEPDAGAFAHVTMAPCGNAFCGHITRTFNASGEYRSPNLGKQIVRDMVPEGGGKYRGKVWRPSNDKVYIGKIDLDGNILKLAGCVAGGLFCAKQTWQRVQ